MLRGTEVILRPHEKRVPIQISMRAELTIVGAIPTLWRTHLTPNFISAVWNHDTTALERIVNSVPRSFLQYGPSHNLAQNPLHLLERAWVSANSDFTPSTLLRTGLTLSR